MTLNKTYAKHKYCYCAAPVRGRPALLTALLSQNRASTNFAGRVAEKIVFNDIGSGVQNDLKEPTLKG